MNLRGEPAAVGRHCGGRSLVVTPELVAFYRDALDDCSPLAPGQAPSLLFHSECYRYLGEWYLKNLVGNLHGRQDWQLFQPVPLGVPLRSRSTLVARYRKRGRDYVVNETDLCEAETGRLLVRGRTHQSFLPLEAEKPPEPAGARRAHPPFPTARGPDLPPLRKTIDARRCWMFSGPGRNYHTDRDEARKLGFPDIVVQGMMTTCFVAEQLQTSFGAGWSAGGEMSVKLTRVIWLDESVTLRARLREETPEGTRVRVHCDVWGEKDDGSRVLVGTASALR